MYGIQRDTELQRTGFYAHTHTHTHIDYKLAICRCHIVKVQNDRFGMQHPFHTTERLFMYTFVLSRGELVSSAKLNVLNVQR